MDGEDAPPWIPENCSAGGGGGVTWTPAEGGGGGLEKWGSVSGPLFCVRTDVGAKGTGTQNLARKFFSTNNPPPPHLSSQNDQRDVGIILSPPPARHGRSGAPALNPPLPSRRPRREGGGLGKWASVSPLPPAEQFSSRPWIPLCCTSIILLCTIQIQAVFWVPMLLCSTFLRGSNCGVKAV